MANQTSDTPNVAIMTTAAATALNPTAPKALGPATPAFDFDALPAVATGDPAPDADPEPELELPDDGLSVLVEPVELVLELGLELPVEVVLIGKSELWQLDANALRVLWAVLGWAHSKHFARLS